MDADQAIHRVSVVIPVYRGESTLDRVADEVASLPQPWTSPSGNRLVIDEILVVWDHGPDHSDQVIRALAAREPRVRPVWLSRNFGQHAATLAGMACSGGDWVVTIDEDGQHNPHDIAAMLDVALAERATLVYAQPVSPAPHGAPRNLASRGAKATVAALTGNRSSLRYHSFRLMLGELARSVAAYAGPGTYLDVALGWVTNDVSTCPVQLRDDSQRPSGYRFRSLLSHFWRMVISSGTRALRMVSVLGFALGLAGVIWAAALMVAVTTHHGPPIQGWTSTIVVILLTSGAVLVSLGVIAEYLGAVVGMAMGKPLYVINSDPEDGPLGRVKR